MAAANRLGHIDGLRGIAAMLVVFQHAIEIAHVRGAPLFDGLLSNFNFGRFGVTIFFLISGFVVPFSIRGESPLRNFAISRVFRLYPAYWLSLAALVAIGYFSQAPFGWPQVLANMTMLQTLMGHDDVGSIYWTLFYELVFYFSCALLFWMGLLRNIKVNSFIVLGLLSAPLIVILMGPDTGSKQVDDMELPFYFGLFFLGMLLRRAFVDRDTGAIGWAVILVLLTVPVGILLGGALYPVPDNANPFLSPVAPATSMALPAPVFVIVLWLRLVPPSLLLYLGAISYSVYLFQGVGLHVGLLFVSPGEWPIFYMLAAMSVTLGISAITYRFVEQPMQRIGKQLQQRLETRDIKSAKPAQESSLPRGERHPN